MVDKVIRWLGSSLHDLRAFPEQARRAAGYQLRRVQQGLMPSDWKPMKGLGSGVYEIRIHTGVEHRVFYVAKYDDAILCPARLRKANTPDSSGRYRSGTPAPRRVA